MHLQCFTGRHRSVVVILGWEKPVRAWTPSSLVGSLDAVLAVDAAIADRNKPQRQIRCHKNGRDRQARPPAVAGIVPFRGCSFSPALRFPWRLTAWCIPTDVYINECSLRMSHVVLAKGRVTQLTIEKLPFFILLHDGNYFELAEVSRRTASKIAAMCVR